MRRALAVILTLVAVVGVGLVFAAPSFRGLTQEEGTAVRIEAARSGTLTETISAPGTVEPVSKVDISAEVSARIVEINRREGDKVQKGDLVIRLDDRDLKAALQATESRRDGERFRLEAEKARLIGSRLSLENARQTLERQEKLFSTGDVSRQVLDDALLRVSDFESIVTQGENTISVIEKSLATAEAQIEQAQQALRRTTIISNIDGIVTLLNAEVGELVVVGTMNNPGTRIMTIADLSTMRIVAKVSESDIAKVAQAQKAEVRISAYKGRVFDGTVAEVALQRWLEKDGTGYFPAKIALQLDGEVIFSGLGGNVDIIIGTHEGVIVPSQAVIERRTDELPAEVRSSPLVQQGRRTTPIVFRVVDGKAVATPVELGASNLTESIVKNGLSEGDQIITGPFKALEKVKPGDAVKPDENASFGDMGREVPSGGGGGRHGGRRGGGMGVRF